MIRWGFLGASRIGRRAVAPAVLDCGHRLDAVAARDAARAEDFAYAFGARRHYGDYAALIDDPDIDAIYNALPNDAHLPWTLRALAAGQHLLSEKPLALNAAEVAAMLEAEAASGKRAMEAFCHIHHPQLIRLRTLLDGGAIGRLLTMQASFGNTLAEDWDFRWHASMGGGALLDLGTYCVSLMRLLAGEPTSASALATYKGDVDAAHSGQLDFAGVPAQFTCSFISTRTQHLELVGTDGKILLDWPFSTKGKETRIFHGDTAERFPAIDPYARMVSHFARMVAGEDGLDFGLDWSLRQARALDALALSARERKVVLF